MDSATFRVIDDQKSTTGSLNDQYEGFQRGGDARSNFEASRMTNENMGLDMLLGDKFVSKEDDSESDEIGRAHV